MAYKKREDQIAAQRRHYQKNKETIKAKNIAHRAKMKKWWREYKLTLKCECGEDHPACLEFHHKDPVTKEKTLSMAAGQGWGKKRILEEVSKCKIVCANCHRKMHWTRDMKRV